MTDTPTPTTVALAGIRELLGATPTLSDAQVLGLARLALARALVTRTLPAPPVAPPVAPAGDADGTVLITQAWIEDVATSGMGWNRAQTTLLGVAWPLAGGWKARLIGTRIPLAVADQVRALKGAKTRRGKLRQTVPQPESLFRASA